MQYVKYLDSTTIILNVYVQPGSKVVRICGLHGDRLKIKLNAPPVDGQANQALLNYLQRWLDVTRTQLELISGTTSRLKQIKVTGISSAVVDKLKDV
jgi:hypothetical protein